MYENITDYFFIRNHLVGIKQSFIPVQRFKAFLIRNHIYELQFMFPTTLIQTLQKSPWKMKNIMKVLFSLRSFMAREYHGIPRKLA